VTTDDEVLARLMRRLLTEEGVGCGYAALNDDNPVQPGTPIQPSLTLDDTWDLDADEYRVAKAIWSARWGHTDSSEPA
jgi:hypothetical protein